MKKNLFILLGSIFLSAPVYSLTRDDLVAVPYSSFTDANTNGNMMFTSAAVHIIGVTISSPAPNSSITFYRSTSVAWSPDISTQAFIATSYTLNAAAPTFIDLFGMKNTSYTHINKVGNAKIIIWTRCPPPNLKVSEVGWGFCPGLPLNGQNGTKIEWAP